MLRVLRRNIRHSKLLIYIVRLWSIINSSKSRLILYKSETIEIEQRDETNIEIINNRNTVFDTLVNKVDDFEKTYERYQIENDLTSDNCQLTIEEIKSTIKVKIIYILFYFYFILFKRKKCIS